jgi:hypothetical protein
MKTNILNALLTVAMNGKTVTGSVVLIVALVLRHFNIAADDAKIAGVVGAAITGIGWAHKAWKQYQITKNEAATKADVAGITKGA